MNEVEKKILLVCKLYIENESYTISDIVNETNITRSSIQRYLRDKRVEKLITKQASIYIKDKLKSQKLEGSKKGGTTSSTNTIYVKDKNGKFIGSVKK